MKRPVIDPGAFTARLTVEQAVEVPDGQGGVIRTHAATGVAWARIEPVSADRSNASKALASTGPAGVCANAATVTAVESKICSPGTTSAYCCPTTNVR